MEKAQYSVEVREATRGGDDYTENHLDFDTPEEVRNYIANEKHEDEHVHSVWYYAEGQTSDPKDVTREFTQSKKRRF
jgi:hypothetical protein